ncbi:MAG: U32 family peptidase [Bacteriovoracaceae bacterium]|jgi:putative protease|nr:U32 family peptidase [Bacteriovoracaceae bacterium]
MKKSELLLPVGDINMCLAAIHNGADAIYLGSPFFNARGRSKDFTWDELKEIVDLCHLYDVDVHVAFNVLIFESELEDAKEHLKKLISLGVDALIIQDIGLMNMARSISKEQILHGSTQMSITNHEAIELLDDLDIQRFVLGRENTIVDIKTIKEKTHKELEVFVHGALCVAYSGQCFTSESLGGRSANRGQCAQSCRFEYDLIVDGKTYDTNGKKYLVSPQDLCGIDNIKELQDIGVDSFKVEGRLKSKEYVATAARSYRDAIDKNLSNFEKQKNNMASSFSRGFYNGWLEGVAHQELVKGTYQDHRGYLLGKALRVSPKTYLIETDKKFKTGDGILFVDKQKREGSVITNVLNKDHKIQIKTLDDIKIESALCYINSSSTVKNEVKASMTDQNKQKKLKIKVKVKARLGKPLEVVFSYKDKIVKQISDNDIEPSKSIKVDERFIKDNLSKLGRTVYEVKSFDIQMDEGIFLNQKMLKNIKNNLVSKLNNLRIDRSLEPNDYAFKASVNNIENKKELSILVRKKEQLESLVELLNERNEFKNVFSKVILDYEFGYDFASSVKLAKENNLNVFIATTRILKPSEYHNFRLIERAAPDGILIRNLGALNYFKDKDFKLVGDFSLNASNSITASYFLSKGLESICLSYDLNIKQIKDMLINMDASKAEVTIYQYMPEFHMEHCVFAAFMSKGNSFRDCGKPCEKHEVSLKDMFGNHHEIKADQECRNTMFNSVAQGAISIVPDLGKMGVHFFRFEALHENKTEFRSKLLILFNYFCGNVSLNDAIISLGINEKYGLSTGQLMKDRVYKDRKKNDSHRRI